MSTFDYPQHEHKEDTFNLGLTMAGAVSAGAYTGGVMDYLFEALDKWERAKSEEGIPGISRDLVPKHNVKIDAIGGTSAGGMTTIMSALYAIQNNINPVTVHDESTIGKKKDNLFYDSWVRLDDENGLKTIEKALDTSDLDEGMLLSLLNSDFIDSIAKRAFRINGGSNTSPVAKLPKYISKDLEMLISHAMITGLPLSVDFSHEQNLDKNPPSHSTYEHFLFSHFRLNNGNAVDPNHYFWLNPYQETIRNHLEKAAKATGAFPVGLKFREFNNDDFNSEYLKNVISRVIKREMAIPEPDIRKKIDWDEKALKEYSTYTVDGGSINNEPFGEVMNILEGRYGVHENGDHEKYGVVMIDPFPDFHFKEPLGEDCKKKKPKNGEKDLIGIAPGIIQMLWNQSKVKRNEMIQQFETDAYRGVIYPVRYKDENHRYINPIGCAAVGAFSGFLDVNFRHHDFFLGRDNAKRFIRQHLSIRYDSSNPHPIHKSELWTNDMITKFKIELNGKTYLPIIPDMNLLLENQASSSFLDYSVPNIPQIDEAKILALKPKLKVRTRKVIGVVAKELPRLVRFLAKVAFTKKASNFVLNTVIKDLANHGLLKGSTQCVQKVENNQSSNN